MRLIITVILLFMIDFKTKWIYPLNQLLIIWLNGHIFFQNNIEIYSIFKIQSRLDLSRILFFLLMDSNADLKLIDPTVLLHLSTLTTVFTYLTYAGIKVNITK